jgi:hypothetical protein
VLIPACRVAADRSRRTGKIRGYNPRHVAKGLFLSGEVFFFSRAKNPHPDPLPEYREREVEKEETPTLGPPPEY